YMHVEQDQVRDKVNVSSEDWLEKVVLYEVTEDYNLVSQIRRNWKFKDKNAADE
ncbi:16396_t:CDS:2, partial [Gigaspora rosea]